MPVIPMYGVSKHVFVVADSGIPDYRVFLQIRTGVARDISSASTAERLCNLEKWPLLHTFN